MAMERMIKGYGPDERARLTATFLPHGRCGNCMREEAEHTISHRMQEMPGTEETESLWEITCPDV